MSGWFQVAVKNGCTSPTASHTRQGLLQEGAQLLGDEPLTTGHTDHSQNQNGLGQAP